MEEDNIWEYMEKVSTNCNGYSITRFNTSPFWSVLKRDQEDDLVIIGSADTLKDALINAMKEEEDE